MIVDDGQRQCTIICVQTCVIVETINYHDCLNGPLEIRSLLQIFLGVHARLRVSTSHWFLPLKVHLLMKFVCVFY